MFRSYGKTYDPYAQYDYLVDHGFAVIPEEWNEQPTEEYRIKLGDNRGVFRSFWGYSPKQEAAHSANVLAWERLHKLRLMCEMCGKTLPYPMWAGHFKLMHSEIYKEAKWQLAEIKRQLLAKFRCQERMRLNA